MLKIIVTVSLMFSVLIANVSDSQVSRISKVYEIGKTIKANDGMTFEYALSSIYLQESSAGIRIVGDKYMDKFYYKHHGKKFFVSRKDVYIDKNNIMKYLYKNLYVKKIYKLTGQLKPLRESSLGGFQIKLSTAKYIIKKRKMKEYYNLLKNDVKLINLLLINYKFSAKIALNYLIMTYNEASNRKMWNPYFKSISRYNGGWNNKAYYGKVMNRMKTIKTLVSSGRI